MKINPESDIKSLEPKKVAISRIESALTLNGAFTESSIQMMVLCLLFALGAFLRLYGLENQSFWKDELESWARSNYDSLAEVIDKGLEYDLHPPGYYLVIYFLERYIGDSEAILRFPSAIAGIFSIPVIFLLGQRLYTYREGLIAASFMAIMWCPIYYSQEARPYSMLLLSTLLAAYFWIEIMLVLHKELKVSIYLISAYIITALVASYLHYYGLYFIVLQGILAVFILLPKRKVLLPLFTIYGFILLAYFPWIPTMVSQFLGSPPNPIILLYLGCLFVFITSTLYGLSFLISRYNFRKIKSAQIILFIFIVCFLILLACFLWLPSLLSYTHNSIPGNWIPSPKPTAFLHYLYFVFNRSIFLLLIVLALYGFWFLGSLYNFKKNGRTVQFASLLSSPTLLLILWLIVPFAIAYGISILFQPILTDRNLIILLPAAYLLLARAITQLSIRETRQVLVTCLIIGLFLYQLLFQRDYYSRPSKQQFREAVEFIVDQAPLYEDAVIIGFGQNPAFLNYYLEKKNSRIDFIEGKEEDMPAILEYLRNKKPHYIWCISAHDTHKPEFMDFLSQNFTVKHYEAFFEANVWLLEVAE